MGDLLFSPRKIARPITARPAVVPFRDLIHESTFSIKALLAALNKASLSIHWQSFEEVVTTKNGSISDHREPHAMPPEGFVSSTRIDARRWSFGLSKL